MNGASFGDLVVSLRADSSAFAADLKKSERSLGGFVSGVTTGFAKIGLAVQGAQTVFGALIGPMQEAQEAALAERKLAQVFKSTANAAGVAKDEIMDYAAERQKMTSFDADDTVNAAAILGSFTNIKGDLFTDALTSAQDLSAFMGQDLQTSVIQLGKALNDPAKGVSALAKSGIQFSQAQKEEIKVLQETGRLADAQAIILKELQTQFGGQAEALVDPIAQAKNAWGDFMETIGGIANEKLLPLMPKLIEGFEKMADVAIAAIEKAEEIGGRIKEFNDFLAEKKEQAGGLVPGNLMELAAPGASTIMDLTSKTRGGNVSGGLGAAITDGMKSDIAKLRASVKAGAKGTAADPEIMGRMFTPSQEADGKRMAGQALAGLIRDGLAGLESGLMSLGPAPMGDKFSNQVGSLEKGSEQAMEVLRANTSAGDKDLQKQQLKAMEKTNEKLAKILKVLNNPDSSRQEVRLALSGID